MEKYVLQSVVSNVAVTIALCEYINVYVYVNPNVYVDVCVKEFVKFINWHCVAAADTAAAVVVGRYYRLQTTYVCFHNNMCDMWHAVWMISWHSHM